MRKRPLIAMKKVLSSVLLFSEAIFPAEAATLLPESYYENLVIPGTESGSTGGAFPSFSGLSSINADDSSEPKIAINPLANVVPLPAWPSILPPPFELPPGISSSGLSLQPVNLDELLSDLKLPDLDFPQPLQDSKIMSSEQLMESFNANALPKVSLEDFLKSMKTGMDLADKAKSSLLDGVRISRDLAGLFRFP